MKSFFRSLAFVDFLIAAQAFVRWHESVNDPSRDWMLVIAGVFGVFGILIWEASEHK